MFAIQCSDFIEHVSDQPETAAELRRRLAYAPYLDLTQTDRFGRTMVDIAAEAGKVHLARALLDAGVKFGNVPAQFTNAYWIEKVNGILNTIEEDDFKLYVAGGLNLTALLQNSPAALTNAFLGGKAHVAEALIAVGADVTILKSANPEDAANGWSMLHLVAKNTNRASRAQLIKLLLANGIDVDIRGKAGATPLILAAASGQVDAIKILIGAEADINAQDNGGMTPLIAAAKHKQKDALKPLITAGADLNLETIRGDSALKLAVSAEQEELVRLLLDSGANPGSEDGWTKQGALAIASEPMKELLRSYIKRNAVPRRQQQ